MIDKFSVEEFEDALTIVPADIKALGLVDGEETYEISLGKAKLIVRSTIDYSGFSRDTGDDSIRISLVSNHGKPLASRETLGFPIFTNRVKGWDRRMVDIISKLVSVYNQSGVCPVCGEARPINKAGLRSKNPGRIFASCSDRSHENTFVWINLNKTITLNEYFSSLPTETPDDIDVDPEKVIERESEKLSYKFTGTFDDSKFNAYQKRIIANGGKGAYVVKAGAGSGKTTTMVGLIISMLMSGVNPGRILAVTFSSKAAAEMRNRIAKAIWPNISERELAYFGNPYAKEETLGEEDVFAEKLDRAWVEQDPIRMFLVDWVCTIHAMSLRLLKASGEKIKVLGDSGPDRWAVDQIMKDAMDEFKWEESLKSIRYYVDMACLNMVERRDARSFFSKVLAGTDVPYQAAEWLAEIYSRFLNYVRPKGLVTFEMMQSELLKKMRTNPSFKAGLNQMFDYILVDEGQDTALIQTEIIFGIIEKAKNVGFIGDDRQRLYAFRGARPEIMNEGFDRQWPDAQRFPLPVNYRSTKNIVNMSNKLIKSNYLGDQEKYLEDAFARDDADEGEPITYTHFGNFKEMCYGMIEKIGNQGDPGKWYILSRTRAECASIHTKFIEAGIPAINLSGGLLFGSPHVRKVLAYARLACNYNGARNDLEILKEIANVASKNFVSPMTRRRHDEDCKNEKPWVDCGCKIIIREGIDHSAVRYYATKAIEEARGWAGIEYQSTETVKGHPSMRSKGAYDLVTFVERLEQFTDDALATINMIIDESVLPWLKHEEGISDEDLAESGKLEDFDLLREMCKENMTMAQFLENIDDLSKRAAKETKGAVEIGTVHAVKGLEKQFVIVNTTRMPITPPAKKKGALPVGIPNTIEDERAIAYVALSRAIEKCYVMGAGEWNGQEVPVSQFVYEMELVEVDEKFSAEDVEPSAEELDSEFYDDEGEEY
jgi:DNA helicase-2/ATP-dependent DNA helicase PcrA